jgi:hypothetical protein
MIHSLSTRMKQKYKGKIKLGLKERLLKNSTIADAASLAASRLFEPKEIVNLPCKMLNLAISGDALNGGMSPGIIQLAAESKHFKSKFALEMVKAFLNKCPDGMVLFYDSEYGTPKSYFGEMNIDRIFHCPVTNLEEWKHDVVKQLTGMERGDKLMIIVDSLGNIPSKKELNDAEEGKEVSDMTRAKVIKAIFRMIMPLINQKDVYGIIVNHVYMTLEMFAKVVPSGGTGGIYNSNVILTITKAKEKESVTYVNEDGKKKTVEELAGYKFTLNAYKSRFVKEESKFPIYVRFDNGIGEWSGMFDLALEAGYIIKVTPQTYARKDKPEKAYRRKEIEDNDDFMSALFEETNFNEYLKKEYQI